MKNKWYLFRKILYKEKNNKLDSSDTREIDIVLFSNKKIEIWEGDGAKQNRIWKPNTAHIDW